MRIALSGKACAGKDSVAAQLNLPRYALADGLKEEIVGLLAIHGIRITVDDINRNKATYRPLLQSWGTDFKRTFIDNDYWVNRLLANIETHDAVVTDVRFPNEIKGLEDKGFTVVRLNVSHDVQQARYYAQYGQVMGPIQINHPSETALDGYVFEYAVDADQPLDVVVKYLKLITEEGTHGP